MTNGFHLLYADRTAKIESLHKVDVKVATYFQVTVNEMFTDMS